MVTPSLPTCGSSAPRGIRGSPRTFFLHAIGFHEIGIRNRPALAKNRVDLA
jgi:hypothetical protein